MNNEEKSEKILQAEERVKKAKADLKKARREVKEKSRRELEHLKYTMGGIVVKYFPECKDFSELEMCRILACAFKNRDVRNLIGIIINERTKKEHESPRLFGEEDDIEEENE